ncbi:hypothetical protein [Nitrosomonas marina]|uniref:Uncharacterized protein n=1 Tax=Nitrosomonas marina TaxID=917 RepID=A0A1H8IJL3_9PROT|nr:hypothetical protein [Nitrosomonas marina]SEN68117.1 hypothetical protein SAMN05216325_13312 [Nitrosomonas marina]
MSESSIVATISFCEQIGENDFIQRRHSRVFEITRSVKDILQWAEVMGIKNPGINDIQFSEYTGSSTGG